MPRFRRSKKQKRPKSVLKATKSFKICTWNIQGKLKSRTDKNTLIEDLKFKKIHVACLQETYCPDQIFPQSERQSTRHGALLLVNSTRPEERNYGLGFYVSPAWLPFLIGHKLINHRMAVIQFHLNLSKHKKSLVTILNVYAPTSQRVQQHPEEATEFYDQLGPLIEEYSRKSAMFFIGGDLNSKLGTKSSPAASFLGNYGKGKRNNNEMEISWPTSSLPITYVLPTRSSVTNSVIDPPGVQI